MDIDITQVITVE